MLRYGMANEESFQSLSEESTSNLSANRKKKGQSSRWNPRTVKSRRWCDAEVDYWKKDHVCGMYFVKYPFSPLSFIQGLVFPLFVTLSSSSSNISSRARAAKHLFTVDRSRANFFGQWWRAFVFFRILGRFWTQTFRAEVFNLRCCIRLATSWMQPPQFILNWQKSGRLRSPRL